MTRRARLIPALTAMLAILVAGNSARAQDDPNETKSDDLPKALWASARAGAKITYLGRTNSLRSYEITSRRPDGSLYSTPAHVTPDGHAMVLGYAFVGGHDVTKLQLERLEVRLAEFRNHAPLSPVLDIDEPDDTSITAGNESAAAIRAPQTPSQQISDQTPPSSTTPAVSPPNGVTPQNLRSWIISSTASFTAGATGPEVFLLTAPNCDSCLTAWNRLFPAITQNRLRVTVIFMPTTPTARQIANAIMQKSDPPAAWQSYANSQVIDASTPHNGYSPTQIDAGLSRNLDLLTSLGENQAELPVILVVTPAGTILPINASTADPDNVIRQSAP